MYVGNTYYSSEVNMHICICISHACTNHTVTSCKYGLRNAVSHPAQLQTIASAVNCVYSHLYSDKVLTRYNFTMCTIWTLLQPHFVKRVTY